MTAHVRIVLTSHGKGQVFVDGNEIEVTAVSLYARAGEPNEVVLTLLPKSIEVDCAVCDLTSVSK